MSLWTSGIPQAQLVAALCRVLNDDEEAEARAYLDEAGYEVAGGLQFRRAGRIAARTIADRTLTKTDEQSFNDRADALIEALLAG